MNEEYPLVITRPPLAITTQPHPMDTFIVVAASFLTIALSSSCCCGVLNHNSKVAAAEQRAELARQVEPALSSGAYGRANEIIDELSAKGFEDRAQLMTWREEAKKGLEAARVRTREERAREIAAAATEGDWLAASKIASALDTDNNAEVRAQALSPGFDAITTRLNSLRERTADAEGRSKDDRFIAAKQCSWEAAQATKLVHTPERKASIEALDKACVEAGNALGFDDGLWGVPVDALRFIGRSTSPMEHGAYRVSGPQTADIFVMADKHARVATLYMVARDPESRDLSVNIARSELEAWLGVEVDEDFFAQPKGDFTRHTRRTIKGSKHKVMLGFYHNALIEVTVGELDLKPREGAQP